MASFKNNCIKHLLHDLRFAPVAKRLEIVKAAEQLHSIIDENIDYPFEFVCAKLTKYNIRKDSIDEILDGKSLAYDLRLFIKKLGDGLSQPVQLIPEKVYTVAQIAKQLNVSTKTIHRWRQRGLIVRSLIFEDGKRRLGITQSALDRFLGDNPLLQERATKFNLLSEAEKKRIIDMVRIIAAKGNLSRKQVLLKVAKETSRAAETVRYTVIKYEKAHPQENIFAKPSGIVSPSQAAHIYKQFMDGVSVSELMEKYHRSKSSIYRIISQHRADLIRRRKIEFIHSSEFDDPARCQEIACEPIDIPRAKQESPVINSVESLTQYLEAIKKIPLLTRDKEYRLFRKYNAIKYLAHNIRETINFSKPIASKVREVQECLIQSDKLKNALIESNLRLVVSIAIKHMNHGFSLSDLVSEGNFALMRSIEKFNYEKGFRFSTYASLAIAKDYAKILPTEIKRPDKPGQEDLSGSIEDVRAIEASDVATFEKANQSLEVAMEINLDDRERYIIRNHYGLNSSIVRREAKDINLIAKDLDITKEKVLEIEAAALRKLPSYILETLEVDTLNNVNKSDDTVIGDVVAIEEANRGLENAMRLNLDERERYVIKNHFGISDSLIRKKGKSMKSIGEELGISKESVRQIELKALQKLRHILSREEFEIFMK